ncbi:hypothetical protein DW744_02045 [Eubacterium sp. AM28-29]|nr:hypothetical protein DW744_02045 [Eubacterium sp. AM28-29]
MSKKGKKKEPIWRPKNSPLKLTPKIMTLIKIGYPLFFFVGANHKAKKALKGANGNMLEYL